MKFLEIIYTKVFTGTLELVPFKEMSIFQWIFLFFMIFLLIKLIFQLISFISRVLTRAYPIMIAGIPMKYSLNNNFYKYFLIMISPLITMLPLSMAALFLYNFINNNIMNVSMNYLNISIMSVYFLYRFSFIYGMIFFFKSTYEIYKYYGNKLKRIFKIN